VTVRAEPHPPLQYQGRTYAAHKEFVWGTHRAMPPEGTLARIRPHLGRAAITRVGDITGLDTIGVPVAVAVRPASATVTVESGKGLTWAAAMTSAAMEGIERFVAEIDPIVDERGTVGEVAGRLPAPADRFPLFRHASISPDRSYVWTQMQDLRTDQPFLVPAELVHLPVGREGVPFAYPWAPSSNGLASGNHFPEAVCAGLYEVVERDATWCWQTAVRKGVPPLVVDPATIDGPAISQLLQTLDEAGVDAHIVWCPTDVGVPTCMGFVVDRRPGVGTYKGYGCHLDPEIAMIRAVTEAVQSRTVFVAGARDDMLRPVYEANRRSGDFMSRLESPIGGQPVSTTDIPNRATSSFHGDVAVLLELLERAGFEHVLVRELDASAFDCSVVRVLVPGLETYQFQWVAAGERARNFDPSAVVG
jgi:ribosomal protein S12 methylthiotransferase accessory factor